MDNIFTLLRFFVPGCLFSLQLFVTYLIIAKNNFDIGSKVLVPDFSSGAALLIIISVGFLSSVIYRQFYPIHKLDHIATVNYLLDIGLISVRNNKGRPIQKLLLDRKDSREDAYQILTIIWHQNIKYFDKEKGDYQGTLINSMGSALIALYLGLLASWVVFFCCPDNGVLFVFSSLIQVVIIFFVQANLGQAKRFYLSWIDSTLVSKIKVMKDEVCEHKFLTEIVHFDQISPNI
jgi:hypothetical protein